MCVNIETIVIDDVLLLTGEKNQLPTVYEKEQTIKF